MASIAAIGATSWGTTLGIILARRGHDVRLLARTEREARALESARENARFVPGFRFPDSMRAVSDPAAALDSADVAIFAVPSQTMRRNARAVAARIPRGCVVVSASKGLEISGGGVRMSEVLADEIPEYARASICAMSGPNLSGEVARGMLASAVIASRNARAAETAQAIVNSPVFRVYTNEDIIGVELCGALKNIIALGAGICDGMELGDNAKAAFIARGLAEVSRLGVAAGANPATFSGLAGIGDMIATCSSRLSRNHYVGERLAAGERLDDILRGMANVAEGVDTTRAALDLAAQLGVEMPIAQAASDIMFGGVSAAAAVQRLMGRAPRPE